MKALRFICLILAAFCLFCACRGQEPDANISTAEQTAPSPTPPPDSICISNGYTLVRPDRCSEEELDVFRLLSRELTEHFGSQFPIGTDFVSHGKEIPQNGCELLIGLTNRQSSIDGTAALSEKGWQVKVSGNQILILGKDTLALWDAAEAFLSNGLQVVDGKLYVSKSTALAGSYTELDNSALLPPILPDSEVELVVTSSDGAAYTPEWVNDLIIVEANLANATPEGTLESSRRVVDHVAKLGANGLWITPIGARTGQHFYGNLGLRTIDQGLTGTSDYAAGWESFGEFVSYAHSKNVRIILDVVTWGTAKESELVTQHPDWYTGEEEWSGLAFDWTNAELREWFTQTCVDLVLATGIDGLRCDCEPEYAGYELFADIRARCLAAGRKILIISEHSNTRDGAFDFEQFGVFDYTAVSFMDQQEKKLNWFLRNTSILRAIRNSEMIGDAQQEIQNKTAYYRYFSYCVSCHDFSGTAVNGEILTLAYQALFAPFIPIWYLGEEFGWQGQGSLLYDKVDWEDASSPQNHRFMETVKQMIAIRRIYADIFSEFAEDHRQSNICAVPSQGFGSVTAYARYADGRAILILPNTTAADATGSATIPFSSMGMSANATWRITDLRTGKTVPLTNGSISVTVAAQDLGIYLIEPIA